MKRSASLIMKRIILIIPIFLLLLLFLHSFLSPTLATNSTNNQNTSVGTYFSGNARWAKSTGWWSDAQIIQSITTQANVFHSVGAKWAREDFPWYSVESTHGVFDWSINGLSSDIALSMYNSGDNIMVILGRTPPWATSSPLGSSDPNASKYPDNDPNLNNWKNYITQVVNKYKNQVKYWEIWNEADISQDPQDPGNTFLPKPGQTVQQSYYYVLKAAYTTIKSLDPNAKVLTNAFGSWDFSGNLSSPLIGDTMIQYIMNNGGPYFDILNIHVYSDRDPGTEIQKARNLLNNWPLTANLPIWVSETNPGHYLESTPPPGGATPPPGGNTVNNASTVMPWWFNQQLNAGATKILWYTLLNWQCDPGPSCPNYSTAGLARATDSATQVTFNTMKNLIATPTPQPGDLNGDGIVNYADAKILISRFLSSDNSADLNHDGKVNSIDYGIIKRIF